nr:probable sphingolipid transporter spinster homolog 2 [Tanacetum cinerariifolium]
NDSLDSSASWFTPKRLLVLFCVINLITYLDRGVIASTGVNGVPETCKPNGECSPGTGLQGEFYLNNFEDGILSSAFMVGLLVASPIFASMAKSYNPFRLIAVGLSVWTFAAIGCGISIGFWTITVCRMLVGVGEASFISLAAPFIDENAPATQLLSTATFFGAVFCFSAFCFKNMYVFIVLFLTGEILVFATQGPVNFVSIHAVKPSLRPLAMAMSTVSIHVFGDVPSSPLVGVMQDKLENWRTSTLILSSILFVAAGIWFIGIFLPYVDRYNEDNEQSNTAPANEDKISKTAEP